MSGGITVTADDIYQLRAKLGMGQDWGPRIGVAPSGDAVSPRFKVYLDEERVIVNSAEAAGKLIANYLKRRFKPMKRGGKAGKHRPNKVRRIR